MSSESENLTTFVTFFDVYKYRIMLFELINELAFFQHYINDVLFDCLHKFCQTYLNDILIYSKILKEHKTHVKEVLNKCCKHASLILLISLISLISLT